MATEVAGSHGHDEPDHLAPYLSPEAGRGVKGWLLTLDHKRIGLMYLVSTILAFFMGGVFAYPPMAFLRVLPPLGLGVARL